MLTHREFQSSIHQTLHTPVNLTYGASHLHTNFQLVKIQRCEHAQRKDKETEGKKKELKS